MDKNLIDQILANMLDPSEADKVLIKYEKNGSDVSIEIGGTPETVMLAIADIIVDVSNNTFLTKEQILGFVLAIVENYDNFFNIRDKKTIKGGKHGF